LISQYLQLYTPHTLIQLYQGFTLNKRAIPPTSTQPQQEQKIFFRPDEQPRTGVGWEITTTSGKAELALAKHLVNIGAKEYITWWCPHCHEQKLLFGKEAYQIINDSVKVECVDALRLVADIAVALIHILIYVRPRKSLVSPHGLSMAVSIAGCKILKS